MRVVALGAASMLSLLAGCAAEEGTVIQITHAPQPAGDCSVSAAAAAMTAGQFDPAGGGEYLLPVAIESHLGKDADDPVTCAGGGATCQKVGNSVNIVGFDVCVAREADVSKFGSVDGAVLDCEAAPASRRGFVAAAGSVSPGEQVATVARVLGAASLDGLYGAAFDATAVVQPQVVDVDTDGDGTADTTIIRGGGDDPAGASRSASWGTYPTLRTDPVVVQVRAVGKLQTGRAVHSNWFSFPVVMCVGCVAGSCGNLVEQTCDCSGGAAGCPATGFAGKTLSATQSCGVFSGANDPVCEDIDTCTN